MAKRFKDPVLRSLWTIAKAHGIREMVDVQTDLRYENVVASYRQQFLNRSSCGGRDFIELGLYRSTPKKIISFFHELGHCIDPCDWSKKEALIWDKERAAWLLGLQAAYAHGYRFRPYVLAWADQQLMSYVGYEEHEFRNYVPPVKKRRFPKDSVTRIWKLILRG